MDIGGRDVSGGMNLLLFAWRKLAKAPVFDEPYGRRVLFSGRILEIMLADWRADAGCAIHDHGGARGLVVILEGEFEESRYRFDGHALTGISRRWRKRGDLVPLGEKVIHAMQAKGKGLTLHLYAPGGRACRLFDAATRVTWTIRSGGAWLPPQDPLARESWP